MYIKCVTRNLSMHRYTQTQIRTHVHICIHSIRYTNATDIIINTQKKLINRTAEEENMSNEQICDS